jgi:hypothetical protein
MVTTEINILDYIQLPQIDVDLIKEEAKKDAIKKLMRISDDALYEFDLDFSFEIICKVNISKK